jgi:hypothetical protein
MCFLLMDNPNAATRACLGSLISRGVVVSIVEADALEPQASLEPSQRLARVS